MENELNSGKKYIALKLRDVDELMRAHQTLIGDGVGAPVIEDGKRVGTSLLRSATILISAVLQAEIEEVFKKAIPLTFEHFNDHQNERYWTDCKSWGNPNPANVKKLFFKLGFADVFDGLSWQNCNNDKVIKLLDEINQVRNRIAHGNKITVDGNKFSLKKTVVNRWRNFTWVFIERFEPFILDQY